MRTLFTTIATVLLLAGVHAPSNGALSFYLRIQGQKQGEFRGDVIQKGREGSIQGIEYKHEIVSPRDIATGQASGKRQHKPITFVMEATDRTYPMLINALVNNEVLSAVEMRFWTPSRLGTIGGSGMEVNYMTITLTNATISRISTRLPNNKDPNTMRYAESAEVELVYQKITVTNNVGKTMAEDSWSTARVETPQSRGRAIAQDPVHDIPRSSKRMSRR